MFLAPDFTTNLSLSLGPQKLNKLPKKIRQDFQLDPFEKFEQGDQEFICRTLVQVLKYPDEEQAELHRLSNRLGVKDIIKQGQMSVPQQDRNKLRMETDQSSQNIFEATQIQLFKVQHSRSQSPRRNQEFCKCCGIVKQTQTIPIFESFEQFPRIGLTTFHYFRTIINVSILLSILLVIYGIFSVFVNSFILIISRGYEGFDMAKGLLVISEKYQTAFSYKSIQDNYLLNTQKITNFTRIQALLIMCVVIVWCLCMYVFKHYQVKHQEMIDDLSKTASDFSVMIQNAPIQLFKDHKTISKQFDHYFRRILPFLQKQYFQKYLRKDKGRILTLSSEEELKKLKVNKINIGIPFYLNSKNSQLDKEHQQLQEKLQQHKNKLIEWVLQFFKHGKLTVKRLRRQSRLQEFRDVQNKIRIKKQASIRNLQNQYKSLNSEVMTSTVFLTFEATIAAKIVYELNPSDFMSKARYFLSCCNSQYHLKLKGRNGKPLPLKISRAPQPQDIKWQNIGFSFCIIFSRRLLTYFITLSILFGTFWFITYLSTVQRSASSSLLSIAISLTISVINVGIGQVIRRLTAFEKDFTQTNHQASLALKSIVAQLINSIAIPVMIKRDNIYGQQGLVEDVFFLAITSSLIGPLLKVFDFYYFYTRILYWHKSKPHNRVGMTQAQLNQYAELMPFQVGFQYIYVANLFLITCFYTPLQPIIPLISTFGFLLMYWAQKYSLLNRMNRPIPGSDTINLAVGEIISLGPLMLAIGALTFSDFLSSHGDRNIKFLFHMISVLIAILFYLLPFKTIYRLIFSEDERFYNLSYFQTRILLASQYDRLNPATSQEGMKDFMKYLEQLNDMIINKNRDNADLGSNNKVVNNLTQMIKKANKNQNTKVNQNMKKIRGDNNLFNSLLNNLQNRPQKQYIPKQTQIGHINNLSHKQDSMLNNFKNQSVQRHTNQHRDYVKREKPNHLTKQTKQQVFKLNGNNKNSYQNGFQRNKQAQIRGNQNQGSVKPKEQKKIARSQKFNFSKMKQLGQSPKRGMISPAQNKSLQNKSRQPILLQNMEASSKNQMRIKNTRIAKQQTLEVRQKIIETETQVEDIVQSRNSPNKLFVSPKKITRFDGPIVNGIDGVHKPKRENQIQNRNRKKVGSEHVGLGPQYLKSQAQKLDDNLYSIGSNSMSYIQSQTSNKGYAIDYSVQRRKRNIRNSYNPLQSHILKSQKSWSNDQNEIIQEQ